VAPDTVVVARVPDHGYVVKRVGRVTRSRLELTSLNTAFAPVTVPREPGTVVGTVVMRWCGHGEGLGSTV
jgi:SOS-response transcriptional repressor LexA